MIMQGSVKTERMKLDENGSVGKMERTRLDDDGKVGRNGANEI